MNYVLALARRDLLVYFRDRSNIFFSLMGVLVVVMLYLLFLRDMLLESYPDMYGMDHLMDAWVLSGILAIVPVTTCAGSLQNMVEDRASGREKDMLVAPLTGSGIAAAHILSTFAVGLTMSIIALFLCLAYLMATGCPVTISGAAGCVLLTVPSSLSASVILFAVTSFIRSTGAFSGLFVTLSVLIGFLTGIYMPMGSMPDGMNIVGTLLPASQMAALFRDSLACEALGQSFSGLPPEALTDFRCDMGFDLSLGGLEFSAATSVAYVLAASVLFFAIAAMRVMKRRCRRNRLISDSGLRGHGQIRPRMLRHGRHPHPRPQLMAMGARMLRRGQRTQLPRLRQRGDRRARVHAQGHRPLDLEEPGGHHL